MSVIFICYQLHNLPSIIVFIACVFIHFSAANKCLLKVAQYASQTEHYDKAVSIYEKVFLSRYLWCEFF